MEKPKTRAISTTRALVSGHTSTPAIGARVGVLAPQAPVYVVSADSRQQDSVRLRSRRLLVEPHDAHIGATVFPASGRRAHVQRTVSSVRRRREGAGVGDLAAVDDGPDGDEQEQHHAPARGAA